MPEFYAWIRERDSRIKILDLLILPVQRTTFVSCSHELELES